MTTFYCFVLFLSLGFWQQPIPAPFKVAITSQKTSVVSGEDVLIDVSLKNTSDHDVYEGVMYMDGIGLDSTFRFDVRDEQGKTVPRRTYPHEELRTGKVIFRTIYAGQTVTEPQPVSARYDMRKPGKYTVQVWRPDPDYEIKSNIVTITVTPRDKVPASAAARNETMTNSLDWTVPRHLIN